jgi:hypothetical protein
MPNWQACNSQWLLSCTYIYGTICYCRLYLELLQSTAVEYYEGDRRLTVFAHVPSNRKRLLSVEDTVRCILHPNHSKAYVYSKVTTFVNHNIMFLVDTRTMNEPHDIHSDDMGVWQNNRVDNVDFRVTKDGKTIRDIVKGPFKSRNNVCTLKRVYRVHGTDKSFRKLTASITGKYTWHICCVSHIMWKSLQKVCNLIYQMLGNLNWFFKTLVHASLLTVTKIPVCSNEGSCKRGFSQFSFSQMPCVAWKLQKIGNVTAKSPQNVLHTFAKVLCAWQSNKLPVLW